MTFRTLDTRATKHGPRIQWIAAAAGDSGLILRDAAGFGSARSQEALLFCQQAEWKEADPRRP